MAESDNKDQIGNFSDREDISGSPSYDPNTGITEFYDAVGNLVGTKHSPLPSYNAGVRSTSAAREVFPHQSNHAYSRQQLKTMYGIGAELLFKQGYKAGPLKSTGLAVPLKAQEHKNDGKKGFGYMQPADRCKRRKILKKVSTRVM